MTEYLDLDKFYGKPKEVKMASGGKILIAVISLLCLVLIGAVIYLAMDNQKTRVAMRLIQEQMEASKSELRAAEKDLTDMKLVKAELDKQLAELQEEASSLTADLEKEKNNNKMLSKDLAEKEQALEELKSEIAAKTKENKLLTERIEESKDKLARFTQVVENIKQEKALLERRVDKMASDRGISLEEIVVKPLSEKAEVLVVNDRFNFIVASIGEDKGIEPGMFLDVSRDGTFIGRVQVEKVNDKFSAATILPEWQVADITEGDTILLESTTAEDIEPSVKTAAGAPDNLIDEEDYLSFDDEKPKDYQDIDTMEIDELDIEKILSQ